MSNARNVMDDLLSILVFLDKGKKKQNFYTEVEQRRSWKCCSSVVDINDMSLTWEGLPPLFYNDLQRLIILWPSRHIADIVLRYI